VSKESSLLDYLADCSSQKKITRSQVLSENASTLFPHVRI
jgi:hypothetical protein